MDPLIDTPLHKFIVVHIGEKDIDGGSFPVFRDQIFNINGTVGQRIPERLQTGLIGRNLLDQKRRLDHIGNRVNRIGQAEYLLDTPDFLQRFGQPRNFMQDIGSIDVIGKQTDHPNFIAAKELAHFVVVPAVRVVLAEATFDRAVQTKVFCVQAKNTGEQEEKNEEGLRPGDDEQIEPFHNRGRGGFETRP